MRIGVQHKEDPSLSIGLPKEYNKEYEYHILRFERYFKLPAELKILKEKIIKDA